MLKLKSFSRLKNIFSRLNPMPSFKWENGDGEMIVHPSSKELLEKVINKYPEFKNVILIAIYHLINTQNVDDEYLTVLTKDLRLISDLVKGDKSSVSIPKNVKDEHVSNILVTCHNHFKKSILPSSLDLENIFNPNIKFTIIVSEDHIGIIVNELGVKFFEFDKKERDVFNNAWKSFYDNIIFCLNLERHDAVLKFYSENNDDEKSKEEFQEIYDEFVGKNITQFVNEFNLRFKNIIYIIFILKYRRFKTCQII